MLRRVVGKDFILMVPGIRPAGADVGDQKRVMTPKEAMEKGATIGMQTFDMHLFDLYRSGKITLEEALRNAPDRSGNFIRVPLIVDQGADN